MIYSRWRPDTGGYDYFQTSDRWGLGDDLPTPRLRAGKLGVASTSAGRPIPRGARRIGSGPLAKGVIAPMDTRGLAMSGVNVSLGGIGTFVLGGLLGWWWCKRKK